MAPKSTPDTWGNFKPVESRPRYRLIFRSFGPEKVGKDHFGLTGPGPIAIQSFDIGLEGVVEKFLREPLGPKQVMATHYQFDPNKTQQADAQKLRQRFEDDYATALSCARTIIWDTETEAWEVMRYAEFGAMSDRPSSYVELNAYYRDLIQRAYDHGVNLQLIQKVKERWNSVEETDRNGRTKNVPRPSGIFEPTGFKEAGYIVQANLEHRWSKEKGFSVFVHNCRQNMQLAGEEYPQLDFETLGQLVFPDSTDADWR